jgi:hypothetical protein
MPNQPSTEVASARQQKLSRLSRVREAFARRDWVGIAIEMIVVALGVLLAFRVEQWGQQRNRMIEERQFLERLHRENARSVSELRNIHATHQTMVAQLGTAIRNKGKPDVLRQISGREGYGCWALQMPAATYNSTASAELIASGRLSLISDPQLRLQLRELASAQAEDSAQLAYRREITQLFDPYLHPYNRLSLGTGTEPICFIDWQALMRDSNALTALIRTYRAHARMAQSRRSLLGKAEAAQRSLTCALHKPECAR